MSQLQLIRHRGDDGSRTLEAIPNPDDLPFTQIAEGEQPILLGSEDLLKLSVQLRDVGFHPVHATISDLRYSTVSDEILTGEVVSAMLTKTADEIAEFASKGLEGYIVLAVTLQRTAPVKSQIRITQNGGLTVPDAATADVVSDLRRVLGDS